LQPPPTRGGATASEKHCQHSSAEYFWCDLHSSLAASKLAVDPGCHDMSTAREDGLDTAKGNLGPKEREAVQNDAHHILGPSEVVLYAFCTSGAKRNHCLSRRSERGKILFTTHRIIYSTSTGTRQSDSSTYLFYPYTTLVSVSLHLTTAERAATSTSTYLKFRDAEFPDGLGERYTWIFVEATGAEDIQHLSAATLCMDRAPASMGTARHRWISSRPTQAPEI
jgi:hypothetical protein